MDVAGGFAVLGAFYLCLNLVVYVFARFSYEISDDAVMMTWHILRWMPIITGRVPFDIIKQARPGHWLSGFGGNSVGNIYRRRGVWLELKRRALPLHFRKRIYITPKDPDAFAAEINRQIEKLRATDHA